MATTTITAVNRSHTHGTVACQIQSRSSSPDVGDHRDGTTANYFVLSDGVTVDKVIVGHNAIYQSRTNGVVAHVGFWDEAGNFGGWVTHALPSLSTTYTRTYYVSAAGSDSNDGLSDTTPKLTAVAAFNAELAARSGSEQNRILFRRGDTFGMTGAIADAVYNVGSHTGGTHFGAYGSGDRPQLVFADDGDDGAAFVAGGSGFGFVVTCTDLDLVGDPDAGTLGGGAHLFGLSLGGHLYLHDVTITSAAGVLSGTALTEFSDRGTGDFPVGWRNVDVVSHGGTSSGSHLMFGCHYLRRGLFQDCTFGPCNEVGSEGFIRGNGWWEWCFDNVSWNRAGGSSTGNLLRIVGGGATEAEDVTSYINVHRVTVRGATEGLEIDPVHVDAYAYGEIEFNACDVSTVGTSGGAAQSPFRCVVVAGQPTIEWLRFRGCSAFYETNAASGFYFQSSHATGFQRIIVEHCTAVLNGDGSAFSACGVLLRQVGTGVSDDAILLRNNYAVCLGTGAAGSGLYAAVFRTEASAAAKIDNASDYNHLVKNGSGIYFCRDASTNRDLAGWLTTIGGTTDDNSSTTNTGTHLLTNVTAAAFDARPTASLQAAGYDGAAGVVMFDADFKLFDGTTPDAGAFQYGGAAPTGPELATPSPSDDAAILRGGTMRMRMRLGLR